MARGCALSHGPSCHNLAVLFLNGDKGVPKDLELGKKYKERTLEIIKQSGSINTTRIG